MENLNRRVSALEKRVEHRQPDDDDTLGYKAQIRVLRADWTNERLERVRMKDKAESLERMLDHVKREYNELNRKYLALKSKLYGEEETSRECCC